MYQGLQRFLSFLEGKSLVPHQGIKSASALQGNAFHQMKDFKPEKVIQNYTQNPKETQYQQNSNSIKTDAVIIRQTDPTAKSIQSSINTHPVFPIKSDSPEIQAIKKRSDDLYDVVTGQFGDCTKQTSCTTTYQTTTCEESPKSAYQYCKKTLTVDMVPHQVVTHYHLGTRLSVSDHNYAGISTNAVTGVNGFIGPHDATFWLDGRLPSNIDCRSLQGRIVSTVGNAHLDSISFPSCNDGLVLSYHISSGQRLDLNIDMTTTTTTYEPVDRWDDQCVGWSKEPSCSLKEEHCVDTKSTHIIQGISVTRDCWEYEDNYFCGMSTPSTCPSLRTEGCEQINSECENPTDSGCLLYRQTFRCPTKQCTDVGSICNGQTYCLSGDCVKQQKNADPDFQRAVSALSVANEAAKSFTQFNSIFDGTRKTCDTFALGFLNCCADSGWGKDHIANCSQEEKDLKSAKDNLQTVYVGEFCKKDALGICLEKRKAYCVFPSKLARIIQAQGRRDQLNIGFGDAENTNCRGITREEFAKLNFNGMDFSDFYSDITKKERIEDQGNINSRMSEKVKDLTGGGKYG